MSVNKNNLIWLDLEMTGLDVASDVIIEIATVVTTGTLEVVAEGPELVIHQCAAVLDNMNPWCIQQHGASGLTEAVRHSTKTTAECEQETLAFVAQYVPAGVSPLCGNSICMDRRFLHRYMPQLEQFFHYRHIDVSTIKELARRWYPDAPTGVKKTTSHRAKNDIHESIEELRFYRAQLFRQN